MIEEGLPPRPRRIRLQYDEGGDLLAEPLVGNADDRNQCHGWMTGDDLLDVLRRELLATPIDDVLDPADHLDPAVVADRAHIAGVEPARLVNLRGVDDRVRVAEHLLGATNPELPELPRRQRPPLVVHRLD